MVKISRNQIIVIGIIISLTMIGMLIILRPQSTYNLYAGTDTTLRVYTPKSGTIFISEEAPPYEVLVDIYTIATGSNVHISWVSVAMYGPTGWSNNPPPFGQFQGAGRHQLTETIPYAGSYRVVIRVYYTLSGALGNLLRDEYSITVTYRFNEPELVPSFELFAILVIPSLVVIRRLKDE